MFKRSGILAAAAASFVLVGGAAGYAGYLQLVGNFHTVLPGELYRSAQPSSVQLERYVRDHGIATVINLRGENDKAWYTDEVRTATELGIRHINFRMTASKTLDTQRAKELLAIMKAAPKPILIHCQAGADRSGLVSALYSFWVAQKGERFAEGQLSFFYGHVGVPLISAAWAMDQSWETLERLPLVQIEEANNIDALANTAAPTTK